MFDVWQMLTTLVFGLVTGAFFMGCYIALEEIEKERIEKEEMNNDIN